MPRAVVVACVLMFALVVTSVVLPGCATVERRMVVTSDPPGALVTMNDQELGRTPFEHDFIWYGIYDVQVREKGYDTKAAHTKVYAPLWQWPPIDLLVQMLPLRLTDRRHLHYTLTPTTEEAADPDLMLSRAEQMRIRLQGSPFTRNPATMPATTQATQPSTTTTSPSTEPTTQSTTAPAATPSTAPATAPATTRSGSFL